MPTILCGDLNDGPDAVTTVLLEGPADGDVHRPDKGDAVRLYNLGRRLPPARAYSRIYQGRGELIDHILATPRPPAAPGKHRPPRRRHHLDRCLHPQPGGGHRAGSRPGRRSLHRPVARCWGDARPHTTQNRGPPPPARHSVLPPPVRACQPAGIPNGSSHSPRSSGTS
ncbi:endonuclease/exonuclease/phosphatase family protein [Micromonospora chersina]|uniref:endonuclease/exonuclease/phosphatase family protein n=1 Tax=Micromonospora chersina TaxID=47854 RepID=UPI003452217E